jgi:hypothetical protein
MRVSELSEARRETISVVRWISNSALRFATFASSTCLASSNDSREALSLAARIEARSDSNLVICFWLASPASVAFLVSSETSLSAAACLASLAAVLAASYLALG